MDINEALARLEIQDVLWTYARGTDRADFDLMAAAYHPDGTDTHGSFRGLGTDFARFHINRAKGQVAVGQLHITNIVMKFDGPDDARVESYFLSFRPHGEGERQLAVAAGRYLDHFQRRDGAWKVAARRVVMDWTREDLGGEPWNPVDGQPFQGQLKEHGDQSYGFLS